MLKKTFIFLFILFCSQSLQATAPVTVRILWDYQNVTGEMKIFEPDSRPLTLWQMGNTFKKEELPISQEITASTLKLMPGMKKQFILVFQNTTDKPIRFFAAPHQATPLENSFGFKFHCLCINHIYDVKPGEYWYRVVEFHLAKEFVGDHLDIKHVLVGVDDSRKNPDTSIHKH